VSTMAMPTAPAFHAWHDRALLVGAPRAVAHDSCRLLTLCLKMHASLSWSVCDVDAALWQLAATSSQPWLRMMQPPESTHLSAAHLPALQRRDHIEQKAKRRAQSANRTDGSRAWQRQNATSWTAASSTACGSMQAAIAAAALYR
jgi:hypothetical protein